MVTAMLVESEKDEAKIQLEKARKVGSYMTQTLGLTSKDLPGPLHQRYSIHGTQILGSGLGFIRRGESGMSLVLGP